MGDYYTKEERRQASRKFYVENTKSVLKKHKKYREENKERIKVLQKNWYLKNKENVLFEKKEYYIKNKEELKAKARAYRKAMPEKIAIIVVRNEKAAQKLAILINKSKSRLELRDKKEVLSLLEHSNDTPRGTSGGKI